MGSGFRRSREGVRLRLDAAEAGLLKSLVGQVVSMVSPADGPSDEEQPEADPLERALGLPDGPVSKPDDPVLARLFPDAYSSDEQSAEFRRYTESSLRDGKLADAMVILETAEPGDVALSAEQASAWLRALNDVRLALGTRLEVTEEIHDEIATMTEDDPRYPAFVTYDWLTYLQDTLVRALM